MDIKRILKSRWFLGAVCLVFALLALLLYTNAVNRNNQTEKVAVFVNEVKRGAAITESDVKSLEVGRLNLSDRFLRDPKEAVGKYALSDFHPDDYIREDAISDTLSSSVEKLLKLDGTRQAISVPVDFPASVSDKVTAGDIVSCIVVTEEGAAVPPELTYLEVLTATTVNGSDHNNPDDTLEDNLSTATLLATPLQAARLAFYSKSAYIHLSLVYRGEEAVKEQFLQKQNEVLENTLPGEPAAPADGDVRDEVKKGDGAGKGETPHE